jgi:hypothetical protein
MNMRRMALKGAVLACAVLAVTGAVAAPTASAQVVPSLMGEVLLAGPDQPFPGGAGSFETDVNCNPDGSGTITFFAEGIAVGPYPGTFTESGTAVIQPAGTTASIEASFTIVSGTTVINGTKTIGTLPNMINQGGCFTFDGNELIDIVTAVSYQARIDTVEGSFDDSGLGRIDAEDASIAPDIDVNRFQESFVVSNGVVAVPTEAHVTGGGWILSQTGGQVSFGFEASKNEQAARGTCTVIDHAADVSIRCLTVDTVVQTATHAYFEGQAEVNGEVEHYRIDVDDLGEPSIGDTFKIETDSYTALGPLLGGNIQIHQ